MMNKFDTNRAESTGVGYLVVKVSTARGAIPLENASVNIRGAEAVNSGIILSQTTDSSGQTERIALPAPPRILSESPGYPLPYALYDVDVFLEGYYGQSFKDVAVFDSVTSIQPAVMIPKADNRFTDSYEPAADRSPDDANR